MAGEEVAAITALNESMASVTTVGDGDAAEASDDPTAINNFAGDFYFPSGWRELPVDHAHIATTTINAMICRWSN